ncbi:MAG: hypothetical protein NTW91_10835 [Verrucomicrobia bacterium]|nr:hypothetical protein [Verrucomicrobiota bacterium]
MNSASPLKAGFIANIYLLPATVNFYNIGCHEGSVVAQTTGYFNRAPYLGATHPVGNGVLMYDYEDGIGTKASGTDTVYTSTVDSNYTNGSFIWAIPTYYDALVPLQSQLISNVVHDAELSLDATVATLTQSKGGASTSQTAIKK